jgi:hypothetical protein
MVSGIAPYLVEAVALTTRRFGAGHFSNNEMFVASVFAENIAWGFCNCRRKVSSRACVADWNALSAAEWMETCSLAQPLRLLRAILEHFERQSLAPTPILAERGHVKQVYEATNRIMQPPCARMATVP